MKNKEGFTLVELLAVIAILAILVIIALPNVINMYNKAQKETFLTEARKVHSEAEKKYISSSITGKIVKVISSEDDSKLDMTGEKLQYCAILNNSGKVTDMKVSNGKWVASLEDGKVIEDLTIDDLEDGNLDDYDCSSQTSNPKVINCTFGGNLVEGAEYINGQYTYRYKQYTIEAGEGGAEWIPASGDGWGVRLTNYSSTDPVTSKVCTYIDNKPILYMSKMFTDSKAKSIDFSSFNTSNVVDMSFMFVRSSVENIDLSNFDTSNVTDMSFMFDNARAKLIDLSSFDISKASSSLNYMFYRTSATIGYAKDQATADKFNDSSVTYIPDTLKFTVK